MRKMLYGLLYVRYSWRLKIWGGEMILLLDYSIWMWEHTIDPEWWDNSVSPPMDVE